MQVNAEFQASAVSPPWVMAQRCSDTMWWEHRTSKLEAWKGTKSKVVYHKVPSISLLLLLCSGWWHLHSERIHFYKEFESFSVCCPWSITPFNSCQLLTLSFHSAVQLLHFLVPSTVTNKIFCRQAHSQLAFVWPPKAYCTCSLHLSLLLNQ